jgi:hypothetical protein
LKDVVVVCALVLVVLVCVCGIGGIVWSTHRVVVCTIPDLCCVCYLNRREYTRGCLMCSASVANVTFMVESIVSCVPYCRLYHRPQVPSVVNKKRPQS